MRLFVAVWPDEPTRGLIREVAPDRRPGLRPVAPSQWHVTLRFMGQVDPFQVSELVDTLRPAMVGCEPVEARVGPATAWLGRGSVLQIPVAGLDGLAGAVRGATSALVRVTPDGESSFRGHLTLARADRRTRLEARGRAEVAGRPVQAEFPVDAVDLVVSTPTPQGHQYSTIEHLPLGGEPSEEKAPT